LVEVVQSRRPTDALLPATTLERSRICALLQRCRSGPNIPAASLATILPKLG
jgi:hypothetical protein